MGWYCHKLATLMSRQVVSLVKPIPSTSGETLKECWWTFIYGEELEQKTMVMMTMTMRNSTQKQEDFVKKRKSSEGEKKLPFLLTRFIRKENLDKRGCKITEIVEREKKNQSRSNILGSIHIRHELCGFSFLLMTSDHYKFLTLIRHDRHVQDTTPKREMWEEPKRANCKR